MPRFAFALPIAPHKWGEWIEAATDIPLHQSREHRHFLLNHGIYREKIWVQRGEGTPDTTLVLWDLDDVDKAFAHQFDDDHERWLRSHVLGDIHGLDPERFDVPRPEVLSGTTIQATATSETQTLFALPIPEGGEAAVRAVLERVEQGDLTEPHRDFLAQAEIHEEWIWLQPPTLGLPALLMIHWIGDDPSRAMASLTSSEGDYARVMRDVLFRRLVGLPPTTVAAWTADLVLSMHVRRSDLGGPDLRRSATRAMELLTSGRARKLASYLSPDVCTVREDGVEVLGPTAAIEAILEAMAERSQTRPMTVHDVLVGESRVLGLLGPPEPSAGVPVLAVMLRYEGREIVTVQLSAMVSSASLLRSPSHTRPPSHT